MQNDSSEDPSTNHLYQLVDKYFREEIWRMFKERMEQTEINHNWYSRRYDSKHEKAANWNNKNEKLSRGNEKLTVRLQQQSNSYWAQNQ